MNLMFLNKCGVIYDHIVPRGRAVSGKHYSNLFRKPLEAKLKKKWPLDQDFGWLNSVIVMLTMKMLAPMSM